MSARFDRALERFDKAAQDYALRGSMDSLRAAEVEREYSDAKWNLRQQRKL